MGEELVWNTNSTGSEGGPGRLSSDASLTKVQALGVVALQQIQQKVPQVVGSLSGNTGNQQNRQNRQNQSEGSNQTGDQAWFRCCTYSGLRVWFFS